RARGSERQGFDRQPVRRSGGGARDRRPGDHNARAAREGAHHHARNSARRRSSRVMTLSLHDTLTGSTRPLVPLEDGHVRMYSCGPTVYGPTHIGNFRSFLFADVLVRYLRYRGLRVTWVMNVTDIDDRIIERAAAAGV